MPMSRNTVGRVLVAGLAVLAVREFAFHDNAVHRVEKDGNWWLVAKDVCAALDIAWGGQSLAAIPEARIGVVQFTPHIKLRH
jgi:hypothetical protein